MHPRFPVLSGSPSHEPRAFPSLAVIATAVSFAILAAPASLPAQQATGEATDARAAEIVRTAQEKRYERWEDVDDYTVYGTFRGQEVTHYYEKITVDGRPAFRLVPPPEYEGDELDEAGLADGIPAMGGGAPGGAPGGAADGLPGGAPAGAGGLPGGGMPGMDDLPVPEGVEGAADRLGQARDAVTDNPVGRAAEDAATGGLQRRLMQGAMQGAMGAMQDDGSAEAMADARTEAKMFEAMGREARFAGTETVDGREAYVLVADDLTDVDLGAASGIETDMRVRSAKIWLDTEDYVSLKSEMEIVSGGEAPPMTVEVTNRDYRRVGGLYEPFDRTIRSAGMASMMGGDSEMQERMQQGMQQMEQMRERMEDMPPAQRRMFEQQMERMGGMAGSGGMDGMTIEMSTEEIVVNEGPPTKRGRGSVSLSGGAAAELGRTIATAGSGPHPAGDGRLTMLQLIGGVDAEANDATAIVQLNIPGDLPEPGSVSGQGAVYVRWADGRTGSFQAEEATITVTSLTSRSVRGEFSMEAEGYVSDDGLAGPEPTSVTVEGTFDAVLPASTRQPPDGLRPARMAPGGGYMQQGGRP